MCNIFDSAVSSALVLWKAYLENLGYSEGNFVTKGDLIDKIKSYDIQLTRTELNAAFRMFKNTA